jgi:hypothetical protein
MAANTAPIYSKAPIVSISGDTVIGTSVISDYTGAGANNVLVFTADGTNGSFIQRLRFKSKGTNNASVARIFINNGTGANTTASNNTFYGEISLPATTASTTAATADIDYPMGFGLGAGMKIYVGISAAAGLASGWICTCIAGNY